MLRGQKADGRSYARYRSHATAASVGPPQALSAPDLQKRSASRLDEIAGSAPGDSGIAGCHERRHEPQPRYARTHRPHQRLLIAQFRVPLIQRETGLVSQPPVVQSTVRSPGTHALVQPTLRVIIN